MGKIRSESGAQVSQTSLFGEHDGRPQHKADVVENGVSIEIPKRQSRPRVARQDVRGIQDLLWKDALLALPQIESFTDEASFQLHLRDHLPQNSLETRDRYAQNLMRWFFPDGIRGLAGQVWLNYRNANLAEEVLRYLYLRAEPMVGAAVVNALFPIAENAKIPGSYLTNFIRERFGDSTPLKSIERVKSNLRKLGFLSREKGHADTLRALAPSTTSFLVVLHHAFAQGEASSVEFKRIAEDNSWKYLGFKSEDQLRAILRDSLSKGLLSKYVVADRLESITFRFSFCEFVEKRMTI